MTKQSSRMINKFPRHFLLVALSASLIGALSGCTPDTGGRVAVSGTVTLGGAMLDRGTIEFHPVSTGMITGGTIRDGRFDIPATTGAMPGKYEVRIYSTDVDAEAVDPVDEPPGPESASRPLQPERINKRYNVDSELTADIPDAGTSELKFELDA